jgi:hypothetical protein
MTQPRTNKLFNMKIIDLHSLGAYLLAVDASEKFAQNLVNVTESTKLHEAGTGVTTVGATCVQFNR